MGTSSSLPAYCNTRRQLLTAIEQGDKLTVETCLQKLSFKTPDGTLTCDLSFHQPVSGYTPLHLAVVCGHSDIVQLLLQYGAELDGVCEAGRTPLYLACLSGNLELVSLLGQRGASVDATTSDGLSPLFVATWRGHTAIVSYLLTSHKPNPWLRDAEGRTCWQLAEEWSHKEAAQLVQRYAEKHPAAPSEHALQQQVSIAIDVQRTTSPDTATTTVAEQGSPQYADMPTSPLTPQPIAQQYAHTIVTVQGM